MKRWGDDETVVLIKAIKAGKSASVASLEIGRSRNAVINRAARIDMAFGKGEVPGLNARREAARGQKARTKRVVLPQRGSGDWETRLQEPYAVFKARRARERQEGRRACS